jgi:hypothetical protein
LAVVRPTNPDAVSLKMRVFKVRRRSSDALRVRYPIVECLAVAVLVAWVLLDLIHGGHVFGPWTGLRIAVVAFFVFARRAISGD